MMNLDSSLSSKLLSEGALQIAEKRREAKGETVKSCRGMKLRSGDKLQKNKDPIYIRFLIRKLERKSNCCKNLLKQYEKIVLTSFCTQLS